VKETLDIKPNHVEGEKSSLWICVDYFNTVVHVFHPDMRKYYALEDLWSDAKTVAYENL
jgi:ribosome-associated protein